MTHKLIISLLGAPGSGKGTQSVKILQNYQFEYLCVGDKLREKMQNDLEIKAILDSGKLLDSNYVNELVSKELEKINSNIILLDGYPRKLDQATQLDLKYKVVIIYLKLSNEIILKRLQTRAYCEDCKTILSQAEQCTKCGSKKIIKRIDDDSTVIQKRLEEFETFTKPVLEYYNDRVFYIDADNSVDEVYRKIQAALDSAIIENNLINA